jgi:hypothetical protein
LKKSSKKLLLFAGGFAAVVKGSHHGLVRAFPLKSAP